MAIVNPRLQRQYAQLHENEQYGSGSPRFALHLQACIADLKPQNILDYGCGQSDLAPFLELGGGQFHRYDPAIPSISTLPVSSADLVINTDVMEHIPQSDISDVLGHIRSLSEHVFFNIATRKASQLLEDGTNAHCTVLLAAEWLTLVRQFFPAATLVSERPRHSCLIVTWRSSVLSVLAGIERLRLIESELKQQNDSVARRLRRHLRKTVDRFAGRSTPCPRIYPDTCRPRTA